MTRLFHVLVLREFFFIVAGHLRFDILIKK